MELKCLCLVIHYMAVWLLFARFSLSFFLRVLLDVNSCHAFLIRNVIRSDSTMMMSFSSWDLQTFHSPSSLCLLKCDVLFLPYCMPSFHSYILILFTIMQNKLNISPQLTIISAHARIAVECTFHLLAEFFIFSLSSETSVGKCVGEYNLPTKNK